MPKHVQWLPALLLVVSGLLGSVPGHAGVPSVTHSYYVPEAGTPDPLITSLSDPKVESPQAPIVGNAALVFFRACPNNDGGTSLANNARIKVVVQDDLGNPVQGIAAADICIWFNGGTLAQGFSGIGADSIIANSVINPSPLCPDVRCIPADAPTDVNGKTFITFTGTNRVNPGVGVRDPLRKWGHYDSKLPVLVLGRELQGTLVELPNPILGSYVLRIKNYDVSQGLGITQNQGERVNTFDVNFVKANLGTTGNAFDYWVDFDNTGLINTFDYNQVKAHLNHDCTHNLP